MNTFRRILSLVLCLAMVLSVTSVAHAAEAGEFTKVTDASELAVGDKIILVADDADFALSTRQKTNIRCATAITRKGDVVTASADTQVLTLAAGTVEGTFALYTGEGYLYAASSTGNQLKTAEDLDANGSWMITVSGGVTSLVAQGANSHNVLQFHPNNGDPLFACYESAKMSSLSIYKGSGTSEEDRQPEPVEVTIAEARQIAFAENGDKYLVRGKVISVDDETWGNMTIADESGNTLYIYGVYDMDGTNRYDAMELRPMPGDEVLLLGELTTYSGNPQMRNGWLQELTPGEPLPEPEPREVTIPEAAAIGAAQSHNSFTDEKYVVTGVITEITSSTFGNLYISDAQGNKLYIYGSYNADGTLRFDAMQIQPAVGDTITLVGVLGQFGDTPQMKNGWITATVQGKPSGGSGGNQPADPDSGIVTISRANAIGLAKAHNSYTRNQYTVTGVIVEITSQTWGNLYIEDAKGNRLYILGLFSSDGTIRYDAMENRPQVGDTITVTGVLGQYNGKAQMKNGCLAASSAATGDPITPALCGMLLSGAAGAVVCGKRSK